MKIAKRWKNKVKELSEDARALYYAYKDPRTPWYARVFAACVVGYALSPIDLIPDFIPVLGHLDDLILIPIGAALALKMIPKEVREECKARVRADAATGKPVSRIAAAVVMAVWLFLAGAVGAAVVSLLRRV